MTSPICSIIIPTYNRCQTLLTSLETVVPAAEGLAEIIVADNASQDGTAEAVASKYPQVRLIRLDQNVGCAARNIAAEAAVAPYLVMLDDDSVIDRSGLQAIPAAFERSSQLAAIGCLVLRQSPSGQTPIHEPGGLPGVFVGCGAAIRRHELLASGGYPEGYGYYGEEYDLCCRLWQRGRSVVWFDDIRVYHRRVGQGRDFDNMLRLLTRNNIRLWDCYAPEARRRSLIEQTIERCGRIARTEDAIIGYERGLAEGRRIVSQSLGRRRPMSDRQFRAMFGMDQAGQILSQSACQLGVKRVGLYSRGKGAEQVLECLDEVGLEVPVVIDQSGAGQQWQGRPVVGAAEAGRGRPEALVVGSLSPGAVRDLAAEARGQFPYLPVIECVKLAEVGVAEPAAAAV